MKLLRSVFLLFLVSLPRLSHAEIQVAVTVDDLPTHGQLPPGTSRLEITSEMLSVLKKYQVPEVYGFINTGRVESAKDDAAVLKAWRAAGYPLGNHTYTHKDLHKVSLDDFRRDIESNENALKNLSGRSDWKYFRYPYLHEGDSLLKRSAIRTYLFERKYRIAEVTIDFEDWSWNDPYARCVKRDDKKAIAWLKESYLHNAVVTLHQAQEITDYLYKRPVKHVLLLHIGAFDAKMLDELLKTYKANGVRFIPLSEALKDEIYAHDPGMPSQAGSEFTFQVMKERGIKMKDTGIAHVTWPGDELKKICD